MWSKVHFNEIKRSDQESGMRQKSNKKSEKQANFKKKSYMPSSSRIFFKYEMSRISYIRKFICSVCVILIGIFFVEIFNLLLVYPVS